MHNDSWMGMSVSLPSGLISNSGWSQHVYQLPESKWRFCQLLKRNTFSVSISAFVCFYRMADWTWRKFPTLRFEARVKEELLNIQLDLVRMNHVPQHSESRWSRIICIVSGVEHIKEPSLSAAEKHRQIHPQTSIQTLTFIYLYKWQIFAYLR